jgi:hypothetical protein
MKQVNTFVGAIRSFLSKKSTERTCYAQRINAEGTLDTRLSTITRKAYGKVTFRAQFQLASLFYSATLHPFEATNVQQYR